MRHSHSLPSAAPLIEHAGGGRTCSFPQHRTPGRTRLQDRQGPGTDSRCSGTPPLSHGLVEIWSDLTMGWRLPAQFRSALFLPGCYPLIRLFFFYSILPKHLSGSSQLPPCSSLPCQSPLPPAFCKPPAFLVRWDLCRWIEQPSLFSSQPVCVTPER